jgi:hypothetical protein
MGLTFGSQRNGVFASIKLIYNLLILNKIFLGKKYAFWTNFLHANFMPKNQLYFFEYKGKNY